MMIHRRNTSEEAHTAIYADVAARFLKMNSELQGQGDSAPGEHMTGDNDGSWCCQDDGTLTRVAHYPEPGQVDSVSMKANLGNGEGSEEPKITILRAWSDIGDFTSRDVTIHPSAITISSTPWEIGKDDPSILRSQLFARFVLDVLENTRKTVLKPDK